MNIEVNRNAPAYYKLDVTINARAEKVYNILANISRWPEWQKNVKSTDVRGSVKEGTEFRWRAKGVNLVSKLHTARPYSEFGWTGRALWIYAIHNWTFTEQNGRTHVLVEESMEGFLAGLSQSTLESDMKQSLGELKREAEKW